MLRLLVILIPEVIEPTSTKLSVPNRVLDILVTHVMHDGAVMMMCCHDDGAVTMTMTTNRLGSFADAVNF